jgi:phage terminase small subunit
VVKKLTAKQQLFIDEYLIDLNATQAAVRAGYSEKTAYSIGNENLKKPEIHSRIEELKSKRSEKLGLDQYWVLKRLMDISDRSMQVEPVLKFDYEEKKMVETGEYVFDSSGANKATELIGKHLGMFTDKLKVESSVEVTFIDDIVYENET